ncbi:zinc metalloprotease HtpX [Sulfurisphaera tokodaii]|uniref:Protease HtpX homolog 2 n=2 Tax=Sulfurisphaera tokodaii TaxID=111955 RepID=HTPX2_SULTO|nr:zinc metalloprotease HtpX [Sulfurisphaera tokodaii]Q96Y22.1 RecName: Full=Protease HtpX homolog 2 [Sulfurisphaera tokodaii str. 7]BAB67455.1 protease HtpX homolog [Sulfurisphaera tokodaii str. 7]HII75166.1 zinc metalloprotease HtpX [Sulfurisphaera tokodaii]
MIWEVTKLRISMILSAIAILVLGFALIYGILGYFFGFSNAPLLITGALAFVTIFTILQWLFGPALIKSIYHLTEVDPTDPQYGWVYNLVQEVAMYNRMNTPKVYIANVPFPNAFAFESPIYGKNMAITLPLLRMLTPEEVKAVIGHEIGHLRHKDTELLLAVGLIPTLLYWIGYGLWWGGLLGGGGGGRNDNSGILFLIGIALIAFSFLFNLFVLFLNRMREAYADVNSAITVPNGAKNLQTALAKIVLSTDPDIIERYKKKYGQIGSMLLFSGFQINEDIPAYKVQELVEYWRNIKVSPFADIFSDHPHPAKRIQLLEKLTHTQ